MPIEQSPGGSLMVTGNAISWFRATTNLSAIEMYLRTGMRPHRTVTPQRMRDVASEYTGKAYARSKKGLVQAADDLRELLVSREPDQFPPVGGRGTAK